MIDVEQSTDEELQARLDEVSEELASIRLQVDTAKSRARAQGEYSDPDWFHRAQFALRMKGQEHQRIQRELSRRKKRAREHADNSIGECFIRAAKRRLDEEVFTDIMAEAKEEFEYQAAS